MVSEEARRAELLLELESLQAEFEEAAMRSQIAARADSNLTPQQVKVAGLLALNGPMRSSQLADALGVTRATVTGLLDRLEQGGLIVRAADPNDARGRLAEVTPHGRQALTSLIRSATPPPHIFSGLLTAHELECLATGFKAMLRAVQALAAESGGPSAAQCRPRPSG
ncbi:MAG: MarR family transcriptional regulator [Bifidobacteriaceae bacterium]|jgi:DNA-binding MarR family transcriptional regulator|nr:MarR family transcriptional regulator [Bifidobacteriaceae bacterium]